MLYEISTMPWNLLDPKERLLPRVSVWASFAYHCPDLLDLYHLKIFQLMSWSMTLDLGRLHRRLAFSSFELIQTFYVHKVNSRGIVTL